MELKIYFNDKAKTQSATIVDLWWSIQAAKCSSSTKKKCYSRRTKKKVGKKGDKNPRGLWVTSRTWVTLAQNKRFSQ
jgi:hypothetical protein